MPSWIHPEHRPINLITDEEPPIRPWRNRCRPKVTLSHPTLVPERVEPEVETVDPRPTCLVPLAPSEQNPSLEGDFELDLRTARQDPPVPHGTTRLGST